MENVNRTKEQEMAKTLEKAIAYVNIKPRTRQQVKRYLREKGFTENNITEALRELEEYRYIDDLQFSRMYFEYGFEKGRGIGRIKRELAEKGVSSVVIEMACDELEEIPDQFQAALEIGKSMIIGTDLESLDYDGRRKLQARIGRRLISRGFTSEIAYKVINRLV